MTKEDLLKKLPSMTELLAQPSAQQWLAEHPRPLVSLCLRQAIDGIRQQILADSGGHCGAVHTQLAYVLKCAEAILEHQTEFHLRRAINATGIILHTGLGRAVLSQCVVDSMAPDMAGYVTLAVDRDTGLRSDRDGRVEYLLQELTGAQAGTVVNNNAAATVLVLSALAAERETIVSRGELIEIGGAFRLPDVMVQSRTKMVEVGTTNRTHLRDYQAAITEATAVLLRVHPSNYQVVGFTARPGVEELAQLAHEKGLILVDDLGAGALAGLEMFGLPHEPTVQESIQAGADIVLFSADKLIGASQGGIIVGRKELIDRIRRHPLARAFRVDKTALMAIERTLQLFRDPGKLSERHPLYRMLATPAETLRTRAESLAQAIRQAMPDAQVAVVATESFLGSGSLPMHALPSWAVELASESMKACELARLLRLDCEAIFGRLENDKVILDVRTLDDDQLPLIAQAFARIAAGDAK
jgi:L-seryl-tRNA(Ser) seleniumtransferase